MRVGRWSREDTEVYIGIAVAAGKRRAYPFPHNSFGLTHSMYF